MVYEGADEIFVLWMGHDTDFALRRRLLRSVIFKSAWWAFLAAVVALFG